MTNIKFINQPWKGANETADENEGPEAEPREQEDES